MAIEHNRFLGRVTDLSAGDGFQIGVDLLERKTGKVTQVNWPGSRFSGKPIWVGRYFETDGTDVGYTYTDREVRASLHRAVPVDHAPASA